MAEPSSIPNLRVGATDDEALLWKYVSDSLRGLLKPVQPAIVAVPVLDRPAHSTRLARTGDRARRVLERRPVAVLEIGGYGQIGRTVEGRDVGDDLVEADASVASTERKREATAGGGECLEAETREHPGGASVPRIRDQERVALMQGPERLPLLPLAFHRATRM